MLSFYVILAHHPRPLFSHLPPIAFLAEPSNLQMRFLYPGRIFRTFQRSNALLPTKHYSLTYPDPVGVSAHYCFKSFSCNTYESPPKCCKQKTYGQAKPFRCNTYKKRGKGGRLWLTRNLNNLLLALGLGDKSGGRTSPATCCAQRSPAGSILWIAL